MKTYQPKHKDIKRDWQLIDAKDKVLGRMSTEVVKLLMGKHKPTYSNHMDMGDYVVVVNAEKVAVTGNKRKQKVYQKHSGYPGGFKEDYEYLLWWMGVKFSDEGINYILVEDETYREHEETDRMIVETNKLKVFAKQ